MAWAPVPGRVRTLVLAREPVAVALPPGHALAERTSVAFADLLDEPFLALPAAAGPLRAGWLAEEHRGGRPVARRRRGPDGRGDPRGPARRARRGARWPRATPTPSPATGVAVVGVDDLPPATLVLAWRVDDRRPAVRAYVDACREVLAARGLPGG